MTGMTAEELERKALRIQAVVEEHTLQEHGMVPMFVRPTTTNCPARRTTVAWRRIAP